MFAPSFFFSNAASSEFLSLRAVGGGGGGGGTTTTTTTYSFSDIRASSSSSSGPTRFNPNPSLNPKPSKRKQYQPLQYQKKEDPDSAPPPPSPPWLPPRRGRTQQIWHQERLKLSGTHKEEESETCLEGGDAELVEENNNTQHSFAEQELLRLQRQFGGKEHSKPQLLLLHTPSSAVTEEEEDGEEAVGGRDYEDLCLESRFQTGIEAASFSSSSSSSSSARSPSSSHTKRQESMKKIACSSNVFYGDGRKFEGLLPLDDATHVVGEELGGEGDLDMHKLSEEDKVRMAEKSTAKNYSIRLLATAPQTAAKLRLKMASKSISSDIIESTIADLQRCGLQCDLDYAEVFARSRWRAASWGPQRLKLELRKRGVAQDDVEKALHKVFQSRELGNREEEDNHEEGRWGMTKDASEHLLVQARRQWGRGGNISNEARKRRMVGWLQRRGFSWSVISEILKLLEK